MISVLRSVLLPPRAEPMIAKRMKTTIAIDTIIKILECRIALRSNLEDLLLDGLTGADLAAI